MSNIFIMKQKKKYLGLFRSTASSLSEGRKGGEAVYWRNWYLAVFVFLILQIVLYYFITVHFK